MPCTSVQPGAFPLGKLASGHGPPPRLANELCESRSWVSSVSAIPSAWLWWWAFPWEACTSWFALCPFVSRAAASAWGLMCWEEVWSDKLLRNRQGGPLSCEQPWVVPQLPNTSGLTHSTGECVIHLEVSCIPL